MGTPLDAEKCSKCHSPKGASKREAFGKTTTIPITNSLNKMWCQYCKRPASEKKIEGDKFTPVNEDTICGKRKNDGRHKLVHSSITSKFFFSKNEIWKDGRRCLAADILANRRYRDSPV